MKITRVSVEQGRRYIPIKGWDGVVKVITLFSNGYTRGARATEQVTGDAIEKSSGAMGLGIFLLGSLQVGKPGKLVDRLLLEAGQSLEKRSEFSKDYDYDGSGTPFFKTGVTIKVLDRTQDIYGIGIWAAYVGDEPEVGLAEHLGIPRTLLSCSVEVKTAPLPGNRFEFDFEPVLRKLDAVLDTKNITGAQVAQAMMVTNDDGMATCLLQNNKHGLVVRIQPGCVEDRMKFDRATSKERDTWSIKGSLFSGELARDYRSHDENVKAAPTFDIVITSSDQLDLGYRKETMPIWNPEQQQKAVDLANKIAAALR